MSAANVCALAALSSGVGIIMACCAGLLSGNVYARLHFMGPAGVLAPWLIELALLLRFTFSEIVVKGALLALAMTLTAPVLTHATAKAVHQISPARNASNGTDDSS